MSFILDALKRADRERRLKKGPDLGALYLEKTAVRRKVWPWYLFGAMLLVNGLVLAYFFWPRGTPETGNPVHTEISEPVKSQAAAKADPRPEMTPEASLEASLGKKRSKGAVRPLNEVIRQTESKNKTGGRPPGGGVSPEGETRAAGPSEPVPKKVESEDRSAGIEPVHDTALGEMPVQARSETGRRTGESRAPANDPDEGFDGTGDQEAEPEGPARTDENDTDLDAAFQEAKERIFEPQQKRVPLFNELPLDVQEALGPMEINVHGYYEDQSKCFVFINIKSYRVGDTLAGNGARVERVTPDGAVIDYGKGRTKLLTGVKYRPGF